MRAPGVMPYTGRLSIGDAARIPGICHCLFAADVERNDEEKKHTGANDERQRKGS